MTDIVERLRRRLDCGSDSEDDMVAEAADEIERLRNQLNAATNVLSAYGIVEISKGVFCAKPDAQAQEITRLRKIEEAAKNLVAVKGRYHSEQAYKQLEELVK